jgi:tRNA (Thr-GGU) A37 N-methylase
MASESKTGTPITLQTIGIIRTPFLEAAGTPIQPTYGQGVEGEVHVYESYAPALTTSMDSSISG